MHEKHFETNEKIYNRIDESNTQFITQSIDWYGGLDEFIFLFLVFFLEKTAGFVFDILAFGLLQRD